MNGDHGLLQQVFLNMLINARDAVLDGGTEAPDIHIDARTVQPSELPEAGDVAANEEACVEIAITDNGMGMDHETQRRMFEPFYTTKPVDRGTGLGLSTVYGIVTLFQGRVTCDSKPGSGTTFRVYLPPGEDQDVTEKQPPTPETVSAPGCTVLIIDDEHCA